MMASLASPLAARGLHSIPPDSLTREQVNPTLLMSWWATLFSLAIIIVRLCGRYVRIERFFPEDKVVMISVIPLIIRMVLVHYVLILGTNNTKTAGLTPEEVSNRAIGSKLVLVARIFYAIFIWAAKLTVCEFLKRITSMVIWRRSIALFLRFLYFFLFSTLVAVIIATLAQCQPFDQYWQVVPDPGPACRAGYANLITMGTCDVITDLLLVAFPVPMILISQMTVKRKISLVILFCLSLILVAITCYRVPSVIAHRGSQPYRSLLASLEILAATAVSNAIVIGSFLRDRGVKKVRYKRDHGSASVSGSMDQSSERRNTVMHNQWGSDSDLAADLGMRLDPKLHSSASSSSDANALALGRPAPVYGVARTGTLDASWSFPPTRASDDDHISAADSLDIKVSPHEYIPTNQSPHEKSPTSPTASSTLSAPRRVSFFDVGGLLAQDKDTPDPELRLHPTPPEDIESQRHHRGSRAFLEDIGAISLRSYSSPAHPHHPSRLSRSRSPQTTGSRLNPPAPPPPLLPYRASSNLSLSMDVELQDVGGLLAHR